MIGFARTLVHRWKESAGRERARRFYAGFVHPGDLVFDVGANVGARTAVFRALGARVVAIEPQSACLCELRAAFGNDPQVTIVGAGLAAEPGTIELQICDQAPTISTMSASWRERGRFSGDYRWARAETVPVTTFDALIAEHGVPAFCKVDVEGFERSVLAGLSRPVPHVSFEFTREFLDDADACATRLERLDRYVFNAALGESMRFLLPAHASRESLLASLRAHPDPLLWGDVHALRAADVARANDPQRPRP